VSDKLLVKAYEICQAYASDVGYHAAVYAKLSNGTWVQADPFLKAVDYMPDFITNKLDGTYASLKELEDAAPNLELSLQMHILPHTHGLNAMLDKLTDGETPNLKEVLVNFFMNDYEDGVYHSYIKPIFERIAAKTDHGWRAESRAANVLLDGVDNIETGEHTDFLQETYKDVFKRFVLWDRPIEEVRDRMQRDSNYLNNRLADLANLPFVIVASMAIDDVSDNVTLHKYHEVAEVGLPHARIGFAVLNDFAAYCDDSLPPGFWAAHWPSLVPVTEMINRKDDDSGHNARLWNLAQWVKKRSLTYSKANYIINKFLLEQTAD
jgi:hypothetical protein